MNYTGPLTQEAIRAYVAKTWPEAMRSPLARCVREFVATDEADRAIGFASLQSNATATTVRDDAMEHARQCIDTRDGWDVETLGHNIESSFPDLDPDECDEIAAAALRSARVKR
jgi:hypothetical protein